MQARLCRSTREPAHAVDEDELLLGRQVLFAKEDDAALGDEQGEVADGRGG